MQNNSKLSKSAYESTNGSDYIPFIPAETITKEFTILSIVIGCAFAILFGCANTYLSLKVGMTIAAGIPAAILGTGILKFIRRKNILEANMISGIAAMGESLAGGIVYTLPAIVIWGMDLDITLIVLVTLLGGLLGIFFIIPFRKYLIVQEHGKLTFPESMAAAEVLVTGNSGGHGFKTVLTGLFAGAVYKFLSGGLWLWKEEPEWSINISHENKSIFETIFGVNTLASLAGVGFIVGTEASLFMFAGSVMAYFGIIPLIKYFGAGLTIPIFPSDIPIAEMSATAIRSSYIRYIGAGAVATGGFLSLARAFPTIISSFKAAIMGFFKTESSSDKRTNKDIAVKWVLVAAFLVFFLTLIIPQIQLSIESAFLVILFSFFFAVVSARICGLIGASNNPVSGMTIASLLIISSVIRLTGFEGKEGMLISITAGAIVCVAIAVAGGAGQALKTTFIIGGTPKSVEIGMYIGIVVSSFFAALSMILLIDTYGLDGKEIQAPQATLMSMLVKGVMSGEIPWTLILVGVAFGITLQLLRLPVLTISLGLYLPLSLSAGLLFGGIVRLIVEYKFSKNTEEKNKHIEKGILLSSGIVAGDAIMGIFLAIFAAAEISDSLQIGVQIIPDFAKNDWFSLIIFVLFSAWIYRYSVNKHDHNSEHSD